MKLLVITPTSAYATHRIQHEAAALGIAADFVDVKDLAARNFNIDIALYHMLYVRQVYPYFAEAEKLIVEFVKAGKKVVDSNLAQGIDVSKWTMYGKLQKAGLPIPKTVLYNNAAVSTLQFPLILKWQYGFGSHHVFLVTDGTRLQEIVNLYPQNELLVQEYIEADCEYKVITVGYKSLPIVTKYQMHDTQKVSDLDTGESMDVNLVPKVIEISESSARVMGRELAKVDILQKGNEYYILEVNRSPGLEPFEKVTKYNVARKFLEYLTR